MDHEHGDYQCEEASKVANSFWGEMIGIEKILKYVGAELSPSVRQQVEKMLKTAREMDRVASATAEHLCY